MIWTTETPTSPGWYWLRNGTIESPFYHEDESRNLIRQAIIVNVYRRQDQSLGFYLDLDAIGLGEIKSGEWAGPLPLPADEHRNPEAWLNGWYRVGAFVFIGTGVHCAGCGKFNGIGCVAIDPNSKWPEAMPDWPFNEASCPLCTWRENPPAPRDLLAERAERLAKARGEGGGAR